MESALSLILFVLSVVFNAHATIKLSQRVWQTNLNFNDSRNWDVGRVPCDTDRVILQKQKSDKEGIVLQLPEGKTKLQALVFSSNSELVLSTNGAVQFSGTKYSSSCEGQDAVFKHTEVLRWLDPQNWDGWNKATPDLERVPCTLDEAFFPGGATYSIMTPGHVSIGSLSLNGMKMDAEDWFEYSNKNEGSHQFYKADFSTAEFNIRGHSCSQSQWCECGNEYLQSEMCMSECPVPTCKDPIKPSGFCCPICGVYFLLAGERQDKRQLSMVIDAFLKDHEVIWHASKIKGFIQVVLVEDGEYKEELSKIAEDLKNSIVNNGVGWTLKEFYSSGYVWYPSSFGEIAGHFFSLMVFAALILAGIIVFYSQKWTWMPFTPLEGRPFVFARFENQTGEVQMASEENEPTPVTPKSFENPMYGSASQGQEQRNVTVENPVYAELEDQDTEAASNLLENCKFEE